MKFIIAIKDEFGNVLSEYATKAEPQHVAMYDSYKFDFKQFHMMIDGDTFRKYLERKINNG